MAKFVGIFCAFFIVIRLNLAAACTTFVAGRLATIDGSTFSSHSDDGETDPRLFFVPSADHAAGSLRNIYFDTEGFPRFIGSDRGPGYLPLAGQTPSVPIGTIPQVAHTFARYEANYGIMNEHQVGMGESTCSGVFGAQAIGNGGSAMLSIDELTRIGLERCASSRCAVQTMGDLAVQYGFYGADSGTEGSSESLMVNDPNEAFIFHILPDDSGKSAIWVAARVPDDEFGIVANMFVVRGVNLSDSVNFLGSNNMNSIAQRHGLWPLPGVSSDALLDFTATFSDGEYGTKFYSGRRVWGGYRLSSPSVSLPQNYSDLRYDAAYPMTLRPDKPLSVYDIMHYHRDFYGGTQYDTSVGMAAGTQLDYWDIDDFNKCPWGNPDRWATWTSPVQGAFERTIAIYRTANAHIVQARATQLGNAQGAILWFAPDKPSTSVFLPIASGTLGVPSSMSLGDPNILSRDSAYWAFRYVFNLAKLKYCYMIQDINTLQSSFEQQSATLISKLDGQPTLSPAQLTAQYASFIDTVVQRWWLLPDWLIQKYADGYNTPTYPDWWLQAVGYTNGPPPPPVEPSMRSA